DKLSFFTECKDIEEFPKSDDVYHFNPIGLVGEFKDDFSCELSGDLLKELLGKAVLFNHKDMKLYPEVYKTDVYEFVKVFNGVVKKYPEFNKCIYIAHFLAQAFHEADHFHTTEEYASGWDYDIKTYPVSVCTTYGIKSRKCKRHKQIITEGNTSIGDGPKYKGKGLLQLTWKGTYQKYSKFKGIDFVKEPTLIASNLEYAIDASCWFWTKFKGENYFNKLIDRKELEYKHLSEEVKNDLIVKSVTKKVNGGTRGLVGRQELFKKIIKKVKG
ncbi:glycoside hydrolase family 19 protein, partial [Arcobacter sp. LA11]|uniref:glycoside hydrolase family 19 protein n=1 Tax=Arcobacter sp. LA11 TaxID=1898176 RepID=UPI002159EE9F